MTVVSTLSAALSATTANTIQGSPPYLTFDGGTTKTLDTDGLLWIKLSDGRHYVAVSNAAYPSAIVNPSSASSPILLPTGDMLADVEMLIPATQSGGYSSVSLNSLMKSPYNYWGDDDGDGQGAGGISATGTLSLVITDKYGNSVNKTTPLRDCFAPYKLVLTSTSGSLSSQYGNPANSNFNGSSVTYYLTHKISPSVCSVKPNLMFPFGDLPQWNSYGFLPQDVGTPSSNFPRTGFNGAFFDITIGGGSAQSVIDTMGALVSPESGAGVTLSLTAAPSGTDTNVLRVTLNGPSDSTGGGIFSASTFKLKIGIYEVYSFELSKWFIVKPGSLGISYTDTQTYCSSLTNGYRMPATGELTNAVIFGPGYTRTIGNGQQETAVAGDDGKGGLLAEWGQVNAGYYDGSDFGTSTFLWGQQFSSGEYFLIISDNGELYEVYGPQNAGDPMAACVTP